MTEHQNSSHPPTPTLKAIWQLKMNKPYKQSPKVQPAVKTRFFTAFTYFSGLVKSHYYFPKSCIYFHIISIYLVQYFTIWIYKEWPFNLETIKVSNVIWLPISIISCLIMFISSNLLCENQQREKWEDWIVIGNKWEFTIKKILAILLMDFGQYSTKYCSISASFISLNSFTHSFKNSILLSAYILPSVLCAAGDTR